MPEQMHNGNFTFTGLPANSAFQVLPLQPGFEFGRSQGVQKLDEDVSLYFYSIATYH